MIKQIKNLVFTLILMNCSMGILFGMEQQEQASKSESLSIETKDKQVIQFGPRLIPYSRTLEWCYNNQLENPREFENISGTTAETIKTLLQHADSCSKATEEEKAQSLAHYFNAADISRELQEAVEYLDCSVLKRAFELAGCHNEVHDVPMHDAQNLGTKRKRESEPKTLPDKKPKPDETAMKSTIALRSSDDKLFHVKENVASHAKVLQDLFDDKKVVIQKDNAADNEIFVNAHSTVLIQCIKALEFLEKSDGIKMQEYARLDQEREDKLKGISQGTDQDSTIEEAKKTIEEEYTRDKEKFYKLYNAYFKALLRNITSSSLEMIISLATLADFLNCQELLDATADLAHEQLAKNNYNLEHVVSLNDTIADHIAKRTAEPLFKQYCKTTLYNLNQFFKQPLSGVHTINVINPHLLFMQGGCLLPYNGTQSDYPLLGEVNIKTNKGVIFSLKDPTIYPNPYHLPNDSIQATHTNYETYKRSPDGKTMSSKREKTNWKLCSLFVHDTASGQVIYEHTFAHHMTFQYSPDGRSIVIYSYPKAYILSLDTFNLREYRVPEITRDARVFWSGDSNVIAYLKADPSGIFTLYAKGITEKKGKRLKITKPKVWHSMLNNDGTIFTSINDETPNSIMRVGIKTRKKIAEMQCPENTFLIDYKISQDERCIVTLSSSPDLTRDNEFMYISCFDATDGTLIKRFMLDGDWNRNVTTNIELFKKSGRKSYRLSMTPDNKKIIISTYYNSHHFLIAVFDIETEKCIAQSSEACTAVNTFEDGSIVCSRLTFDSHGVIEYLVSETLENEFRNLSLEQALLLERIVHNSGILTQQEHRIYKKLPTMK